MRTQYWSGSHIVAEGKRQCLIIQLPLGGIYSTCGSSCRGVFALIVLVKPPNVRDPPDDAAVANSAASEHIVPEITCPEPFIPPSPPPPPDAGENDASDVTNLGD